MLFNKKYHIKTYGCQMNEHDSEIISHLLESCDFEYTNKIEEANILIYNTCAIRKSAEDKVYGHIGEVKNIKSKFSNMIIAVCGCMMQKKEIREYVVQKYPQVDIIFGTNNINKLPELIQRHIEEKKIIIDIDEENRYVEQSLDAKRKYTYKSYVNIVYGCNNFCTFCIVPHTRGRERSRPINSIVVEVERLVSEGVKEITLLGQNVNSYGKYSINPTTFANLLKELNKINGLDRIRFMSPHPKDVTDDFINCYSTLDKLCNQLHLPVQSGSDRILKIMNRRYTRQKYIDIINKIKNIDPNISITTDIIVGFPGETDEDFQETLSLIDEVEFDAAYTFLYSKRVGTKAANMENQVNSDVKTKRYQELLNKLYPIGLKKNLEYIDNTYEVLVEEQNRNNPDILSGRTRSGKLVNFIGGERLIGNIVSVKIIQAKTFYLEGELV